MAAFDPFAHPSLILAAGLLLVYLGYGAVYRLYLSPIAHFPGPRVAALTFWYEFYYDVICAGQYTWRIKEMHEQYGKSPLPKSPKEKKGFLHFFLLTMIEQDR